MAASTPRKINPCVVKLRKEAKLKRESQLPDLPKDVTVKILQKLPFKYLMRFRCVCKSWKALFSDPLFMKYRNRRQILITSFERPLLSVNSLDIEASEVPRPVNMKLPGKWAENSFPFQFLGTCDGLMLSILDGESLFLWNPSTTQLKRLPEIGSKGDIYAFYGFGYDRSSDDYKVLRGVCYDDYMFDENGAIDYSRSRKRKEVQVYSRRCDSWKRIGNCPYDEVLQVDGAYADGFFYWLVLEKMGKDQLLRQRIGCFDLGEEKFKNLQQPKFVGHLLHLGVLEGCLCLVCNHYESGSGAWTIWVMKEHGVKNSWTKLINIPLLYRTPFVIPFCVRKNGEIVLQVSDRKIVTYNPKTKSFEVLVHKKFEIETAVYTESNLSPSNQKRKPTAEGRKILKSVKLQTR